MPSLYVTPNSLKQGGLSQIDDDEAEVAQQRPRFGALQQSQGTSCFEQTAKGSASELSPGRLVSKATSPPQSQEIPVQQLSDLF